MNLIDIHSFKSTVIRLTLLFWILFKAMSFNLWLSWERTFPELPVLDFLSQIPDQLSDSIAILSVLAMIGALIKPTKVFLIVVLVLEIFLMSLDQMRWQPTLFQFLITLSIGVLKPKAFKPYFFLLLSATYVFSGLHKLNLGYVNFMWGKFFLIDYLGVPPEIAYHRLVKAAGLVLPLIEIFAGLLIWTRYRKLGWRLLIIMHLLLLWALGPLGINFNSIIWPWNVLMIFFAILFLKEHAFRVNVRHFMNLKGAFYLLFLVLLPVLSFFGKYSPFTSFSLYSGNSDYLYLNSNCLSANATSFKSMEFEDNTYISIFDWSMEELNVPMVPYLPVFKEFKFYYNEKCSGESKYKIRSYPYKLEDSFEF